MAEKQVVTRPGGTITHGADTSTIGAAGGKTIITVPTGKSWQIMGFQCDVTASATVGNRVLVFKIFRSGGTLVWMGTSSANVTAGQIGGYDVSFGAVGAPSTTVRRNLGDTANTNVQVRDMCAVNLLNTGAYIIIDDLGNIDNADAITWRWHYIEYEA